MNSKRILGSIITAAVLSATVLTGCTVDGKKVFFTTGTVPGTVFRMGKLTCSNRMAKVYLANYYNIYGRIGDIDLWKENLNVSRLQNNITKAALDRLSMVYALNLYADEHDIELTSEEKNLSDKAAGKYYSSLSGSDRKALSVSEKDIRRMYEMESLSSKVYTQIVSKADDEVSDDEARVMDAILITLDADDDSTAEKAEKELDDGTDISIVAKEYSTEKKTQVTICRNSYPDAICNAGFALSEKQHSKPVKTSDGIYIIYCVSRYDEAKSDENRNNIISSRKKKIMDSIIKEQNAKDYSYIDEKAWKNLSDKMGHDISTDSYFEVLSDYLSF